MAHPLHNLTKKEEPFRWEESQQTAFDMLKKHFTTAPVLAFPDLDCKFRLESDASDYTTGAILSIERDGIWHPVTFSSHSMMPQEWNYLVADKEMLSVIQALEQWCHYLEGARHQFEIWNDHANLQWFMTRQDLNRRRFQCADCFMDVILIIVFLFFHFLDESGLVLQHVTVSWAMCHLDRAF